MAMPTIAESLKYANLQMAAEAFLFNNDGTPVSDQIAALIRGNGHASRFTDPQAEEFIEYWQVVDQVINTPTGFSATLFKAVKTNEAMGIAAGEFVISFRSTEFIEDAARDTIATNQLEIADTGWAWGQLSDMEAWYASIKDQITGPLSVTGYSLGGHLATAFNLMHGDEVSQVITFNGAGVGLVMDGYDIASCIQYFDDLRNEPVLILDGFTDPVMQTLYPSLANKDYRVVEDVNQARASIGQVYGGVLTDDALTVLAALTEIEKVILETQRLREIDEGPGSSGKPADVPVNEIEATALNYRMAVYLVSQFSEAAGLISDGLGNAVIGKDYLIPPTGFATQYDLMGEGSPSMVANSQWHYGTEVIIFIEDQPTYRGGIVGDILSWDYGVKLLVDDYGTKDFGDTHSLSLIVDSLSVQNALIQLVAPQDYNTGLAQMRAILEGASYLKAKQGDVAIGNDQGKAEGDVLENVVNALADLFLGPENYTRLNGSPEGNTWAKNTGESGLPAAYTGRDDLHRVLADVVGSDAYKNGIGKLTLAVPSADIDEKARTDFGAFAALYSLSPFVLSGVDAAVEELLSDVWKEAYSAWDADRAKTPAERERGDVMFSDQWLADRAKLLGFVHERNLNNDVEWQPTSALGQHYADNETGVSISGPITTQDLPYQRQIIFGADAEESIDGKERNDRLYGGAGNDTIKGGGGSDHIEGNDDNDKLFGNGGNDTLLGGAGNDELTGGEGVDTLKGGEGFDTYFLNAGDGADIIIDSDGQGVIKIGDVTLGVGKQLKGSTNVWEFESGDLKYRYTLIDESGGAQPMGLMAASGSGHRQSLSIERAEGVPGDRILIQNFTDGGLGIRLEEGDEEETPPIQGVFHGDLNPVVNPETGKYEFGTLGNVIGDGAAAGFDDRLFGDGENNELYGHAGNDIITAKGGDDVIEGGEGDDILGGGDGSDTLRGGDGNDYLFGSWDLMSQEWSGPDNPYQRPQDVVIHATGWNWTIHDDEIDVGGEEPLAIHRMHGVAIEATSHDDVGNYLYGGEGNDSITSGAGDDMAFGEAGDDTIWGLYGNDILDGGDGADKISGDGSRHDVVFSYAAAEGHGNDILIGGAGDDQLLGQGGDDSLYGGDDNDKLWGDDFDLEDVPENYHGKDFLHGGAGDDYLEGGGNDDVLFGGSENDNLFGDSSPEDLGGQHHGQDTLHGDEGNDQLTGGGNADVLFGGEGDDSLYGDHYEGGLESQYQGKDYLDGGAGDDYLEGGGEADTLYGGDGNDTLKGDGDSAPEDSHGEDYLSGGAGDDYIAGGGGGDVLLGDAGNDALKGEKGNDYLDGGADDDSLDGGEGDDVLHGGAGSDNMKGGEGDDTYVLNLGDSPDTGSSDVSVYESIEDASGTNTIEFGGGINRATVKVLRVGTTADLVIQYGAGDGVYIVGGVDGAIANVRFFDGTTVTMQDLMAGGLHGGAGPDVLAGYAGDDVIDAGAGNDTVRGYEGNDVIRGGGGVDFLDGGEGDDRYEFGYGDSEVGDDGVETVEDSGGQDTVAFASDVSEDDFYAYADQDTGDVILEYTYSDEHFDAILIKRGLFGEIESFELANGTTLSWRQLLGRYLETPLNLYSEEAGRQFAGGFGDDEIIALGGESALSGGQGYDFLVGGGGNNTYYYEIGDGEDEIFDAAGHTDAEGNLLANRIVFGAGITPADVRFALDSLMLYVGMDENDRIYLSDFDNDNPTNVIDLFEFADGTTLTFDQLRELGARIDGEWADDILEGTSGDDVIVGYEGNDELRGGEGNDVYVYNYGDGWDYIYDVGGDADVIRFGEDIAFSDLTFYRYGEEYGFGLGIEISWDGGIYIEGHYGDLRNRIEAIEFADGSRYVEGGDGDDIIEGTSHSDVIAGGYGSDTLIGHDGDDLLFGEFPEFDEEVGEAYVFNAETEEGGGEDGPVRPAGNDTLIGGAGNDTLDGGFTRDEDSLQGGSGDDTYIFREGAGTDEIIESGDVDNVDVIRMENVWSDVLFRRDGDDLLIRIDSDPYYSDTYGEDDDSLKVRDFFARLDAQIERVEFFDRYYDGGDGIYDVMEYEEIIAALGDGTYEDDVLIGSAHDDLLFGRKGDDVLEGREGNDLLTGGEGNDILDGGTGNDVYVFGLGNGVDRIVQRAGDGADTLSFGSDVLPSDVIVTRNEADLILAIRGTADRVHVANWFIDEDARIATVEFDDGTVWTQEQIAAMAIVVPAASETADVIGGTSSADIIQALAGDDTVFGLEGDDTLDGGGGDDTLYGGEGADVYRFGVGSGDDRVIESSDETDIDIVEIASDLSPADVQVTRNETDLRIVLRASGESLSVVDWFIDPSRRIEAVRFSNGTAWNAETLDTMANTPTADDDFLVGDDTDNTLEGGEGGDTLLGGAGNDVLIGGAGSDVLVGGDGNDVYVIEHSAQSDLIRDQAGFDVVMLGEAFVPDQVLVEATEDDYIKLRVFGEQEGVWIDLWPPYYDGIEEVRFADGTIWDAETLNAYRIDAATVDRESINGSIRDDLIDGLGGSDSADGGAGNDRHYFRAGYGTLRLYDSGDQNDIDTVVFGEDLRREDIVVRRSSDDLISEFGESDRVELAGHFSERQLERFEFADGSTMTVDDMEALQIVAPGTDSADTIYGSVGDDHIDALIGDDRVYGDRGNDTIDGGPQNDTLYGEQGDDVLNGGAGIDRIYGGEGNDTLTGGTNTDADNREESDHRYGYWYSNADYLDGGAGDDTYVIHAGDGYDEIAASAGIDTLWLADISAEDIIIDLAPFWKAAGDYSFDFIHGIAQGDRGAVERIASDDGFVIAEEQFADFQLTTLNGTGGDDVIEGSYGPNSINVGDGDDIVYAGGGRDSISGGNGNDFLDGGSGSDSISDSSGENVLLGGAGNDTLNGRGLLSGGDGNDRLIGTGVLDGGAGDDILSGSGTVVFGRGYGRDLISSGTFQVRLTSDVRPEDIVVSGAGYGSVADNLAISIAGTSDVLAGLNSISALVFADGTTWTVGDLRTRAATHQATGGNDAIAGTAGDDIIVGLAGDDALGGNEGDDTVIGGEGDDALYGDAGNDTLLGGEGTDDLYGGVGNDSLLGGEGADTLYGGDGDDILDGGPDSESFDRLYGGTGVDSYYLRRGQGGDIVYEPQNIDELSIVLVDADISPDEINVSFSAGELTLRIGDTQDGLIFSGISHEDSQGAIEVHFANGEVWSHADITSRLMTTEEGESILGSHGDDMIAALGGDDSVYASRGDDVVDGGAGGDRLYGQDGNDTLAGNAGADDLYGGRGDDALYGGTGNDNLSGDDGNDYLDGGAGNDVLNTGAGADTVVFGFGSGSDTWQSSSSDDLLLFGPGVRRGDVTLNVENGALVIALVGTEDQLRIQSWSGANVGVARFDDGTEWRFADNVGPVIGSAGNDYISEAEAPPFNDVIYGLDGHDTLYGGLGNDRIYGGAGNDTLYGGSGADILDGGAGFDSVVSDASDTVLFGFDSESDSLYSATGGTILFRPDVRPEDVEIAELVLSESYGNYTGTFSVTLKNSSASLNGMRVTVSGEADNGVSTLFTFKFADGTIWSGAEVFSHAGRSSQLSGNTVHGTSGNDVLLLNGARYASGDAGDDQIIGGNLNDHLLGGSGNDSLRGGLGTDNLVGGDGKDLLDGGAGDDTLDGGAGADTYRFEAGFGQDTVSSVSGGDTVYFSGIQPEQIQITRSSNNLILSVAGSNDKVTLTNAIQISAEGSAVSLGNITFEDGTTWDAKEVLRRVALATVGNDTLNGSTYDEVLDGLAGNDQLYGYAGHDVLIGGEGDDSLSGGTGNDLLDGGAGNDLLLGGENDDLYVFGRGFGSDVIMDGDATPGNVDTVLMNVRFDEVSIQQVEGRTVITILDTSETQTLMQAARGLMIERVRFIDGTVIDPTSGAARVSEAEWIQGIGELVVGSNQRFDTLQAGWTMLAELEVARDSADLVISNGPDSVRFVGWFDRPNAPSILQMRLGDGSIIDFNALSRIAMARVGSEMDETLEADESFAASLSGGAGDDRLLGGARDDELSGNEGSDFIDGGAGADVMRGGQGDDIYVIDNPGDLVIELPGEGSDTLRLNNTTATTITVLPNIENLEVLGGGAVTLIGDASDNRLVANAAVNRLEGHDGNDVLDGGAGADTLIGGRGDDTYIVDNTGETIVEALGEGNDTIRATVSYSIATRPELENIELLGAGNLTATGNDLANRLIGNAGRNALTGNGGDDFIDGGAQDDVMRGGTGDDIYIVDHIGDQAIENAAAGIDEVRSSVSFTLGNNVEKLLLTGTEAINATGNGLSNVLTGNDADNVLIGHGGDDRLDGGAGNDVMKGGTGADTYVFGPGGGVDRVVEEDSSSSIDTIEIAPQWAASDLSVHWSGNDLVLAVVDGADRLTVQNFKQASGAVERIHFLSTGEVWDYATIVAAADATPDNNAPTLNQTVSDQSATAGDAFDFLLPTGVFSDSDTGDHLNITATLADGTPLPSWLTFDAANFRFSGTPGIGDIGIISIRVTATDWANASVSDVFDFDISLASDSSPMVVVPIADQNVMQHEHFSFVLPDDMFFDPDADDTLTLSARLASGEPLPSWLHFDPQTRQFYGVPPKTVAGAIGITVTATDNHGRTASDSLLINVADVNDAPVVNQLISDQVLYQGETVNVQVPADAFVDLEGGALSLSIGLAGGGALPDWLQFDAQTLTISGVAPDAAVGVTAVRLTATDVGGLSSYFDFDIVVGEVNDAPILAVPIADQFVLEGEDFLFRIPTDAFVDPDEGDALTYTVSILSEPSHAKSYLSYNSSGQTIGTNSPFGHWDVGKWTIRVTAEDRLGLKISDEFILTVGEKETNHKPVIADVLTPWNILGQVEYDVIVGAPASAGTTINLPLPLLPPSVDAPDYQGRGFIDYDSDELTYTATPGSGNPITNWSIDPETGVLSYVTVNSTRSYEWIIAASDPDGASASYIYNAVLNRSPIVSPIQNITIKEDEAFTFTLPAGSVFDPDGDTLQFEVDGFEDYDPEHGQVFTWGSFNAATHTFYGVPGDYTVGTHTITLKTRDGYTAWQEQTLNRPGILGGSLS